MSLLSSNCSISPNLNLAAYHHTWAALALQPSRRRSSASTAACRGGGCRAARRPQRGACWTGAAGCGRCWSSSRRHRQRVRLATGPRSLQSLILVRLACTCLMQHGLQHVLYQRYCA